MNTGYTKSQMEDEKQSELQKKLQDINRDGEERAAKRIATKHNIEYVDLRKTPASVNAVALILKEAAEAASLVAIQSKTKEAAIAVSNPTSEKTKEVIKNLEKKGYKIKQFVASLSGIKQVWGLYDFIVPEAKDITGKVAIGSEQLKTLLEKLKTVQAVHEELNSMNFKKVRVSKLLETILAGALSNRASDIHFEAMEETERLRYRIDGVLQDVFTKLPEKNYLSLVSRIKLLSGLKINIYNEPQDGRFTIDMGDKQIEMRVSLIPSEYGETIVMRILDPDAIEVELQDLGMREDDMEIVMTEIDKPNGLILNTGPTGSGKTTTLYAFLKSISNPKVKLITIEDPIEYHVEGIEQTQVDPGAGYTFAGGLRAIVRQDPDVILVGEIRDLETADIALQASLTGHLVLSTLHSNDAVGAIPRLIDLGAKVQSIGPALSLVIAQRLIRKLCEHCKIKEEMTPGMSKKLDSFFTKLPERVDKLNYKEIALYKAGGCEKCNTFGYKGRIGIFEFFRGVPELEELILKDASYVALTKFARNQGMVTMQEDGVLKIIQGITTLEEVEEATGPILWELGLTSK